MNSYIRDQVGACKGKDKYMGSTEKLAQLIANHVVLVMITWAEGRIGEREGGNDTLVGQVLGKVCEKQEGHVR